MEKSLGTGSRLSDSSAPSQIILFLYFGLYGVRMSVSRVLDSTGNQRV